MSNKAGIGIILVIILLLRTNTNCFCFQDQLQECLDLYKKIYQIMDKEYYKDVSREKFEKFMDEVETVYPNKILQQDELDQFKYYNAKVLVNRLKDPQDNYSYFYVGEEAEKIEQTAFGYEEGLGIEGELIDNRGFKVTWVEPRSDSFEQGIRENDIIIEINGEPVRKITNEQIIKKLKPNLGVQVKLKVISHQDNQKKLLVVTCEKFDKKTSFLIKTKEPDIFCIQIKCFNKMIFDDLNEILDALKDKAISGIILDFQDNTGGTTYIIEYLAGYFLDPGKRLYYIKTKSQGLTEFFSQEPYPNYSGLFYNIPLIGLMSEKTASAAELILGVLKTHNRIILVGQNSQGAGYQKKPWSFSEDGKRMSLLELVTSLFYLSDGSPFDNEGLRPDYEILDNEQALSSAVDILIERRERNSKKTLP